MHNNTIKLRVLMVADNNWFNYCFIGFFPSLEENWQNVESHIRALECYCRHVESIDIGDTETSLRYTCRKELPWRKKKRGFPHPDTVKHVSRHRLRCLTSVETVIGWFVQNQSFICCWLSWCVWMKTETIALIFHFVSGTSCMHKLGRL